MRWNMSPKRYYELQYTTCHSEWGKLSHQIPIKIDSILLTSLYCFEDQVILFMYVPVHVHVYSWVYCVFKCTCMCVHLPMEARGRPQVSSSGPVSVSLSLITSVHNHAQLLCVDSRDGTHVLMIV